MNYFKDCIVDEYGNIVQLKPEEEVYLPTYLTPKLKRLHSANQDINLGITFLTPKLLSKLDINIDFSSIPVSSFTAPCLALLNISLESLYEVEVKECYLQQKNKGLAYKPHSVSFKTTLERSTKVSESCHIGLWALYSHMFSFKGASEALFLKDSNINFYTYPESEGLGVDQFQELGRDHALRKVTANPEDPTQVKWDYLRSFYIGRCGDFQQFCNKFKLHVSDSSRFLYYQTEYAEMVSNKEFLSEVNYKAGMKMFLERYEQLLIDILIKYFKLDRIELLTYL